MVAAGAIAASQVVFWGWIFPVNRQTSNFAVQPDNWMALRQQWEYGHAGGAIVGVIALVAVIASVLTSRE